MKKHMIQFVSQQSGTAEEKISSLSWSEMVNFILHHLAGERNRWCINDRFMYFMAKFGQECIKEDIKTGHDFSSVLFTVAMQRLSKGAVLHAPVDLLETLPFEFRGYSSYYDDYHIMTPGCLEFIYHGLPVAAKHAPTKDYALTIAWGLLRHLDELGVRYDRYSLDCENPLEEGKQLYRTAKAIIENNLPNEEIFAGYAQPYQWQKHTKWLKIYLAKEKRWQEFFKKIGISSFAFKHRLKIRKAIKNA